MEYNLQLLLAIGEKSKQASSDGVFEWITEWLGYLPYGQYQWLEINNKDISTCFEFAWEYNDLVKLAQIGLLTELSRQDFGEDKVVVSYRLHPNWDTISLDDSVKIYQ